VVYIVKKKRRYSDIPGTTTWMCSRTTWNSRKNLNIYIHVSMLILWPPISKRCSRKYVITSESYSIHLFVWVYVVTGTMQPWQVRASSETGNTMQRCIDKKVCLFDFLLSISLPLFWYWYCSMSYKSGVSSATWFFGTVSQRH
jgi:hypothetical protein